MRKKITLLLAAAMLCVLFPNIAQGEDSYCEHSIITIPAVEPTCTEDGLTYGEQCELCGAIIVAQKIISKEHQGGTTTKITKSTMTKNGKLEVKCETCGATLSTETIYRIKTIKLSPKVYTYDGGRKSPIVKIYDSKGNQIANNQALLPGTRFQDG